MLQLCTRLRVFMVVFVGGRARVPTSALAGKWKLLRGRAFRGQGGHWKYELAPRLSWLLGGLGPQGDLSEPVSEADALSCSTDPNPHPIWTPVSKDVWVLSSFTISF